MNESIKDIRVNSKTGKFEGEGIQPSDSLGVVILRVDHGQQLHLNKYSGQDSAPDCMTADGVVPVLPYPAPKPWLKSARSAFCATCEFNQTNTPKESRCKPLWSAVVLLATGEVRRLLLNVNSQSAFEQWVHQLQGHISRVNQAESLNLRMCDFSICLSLQKRPTMKLTGLAYPSGPASFVRIPFINGVSKYGDLSDLHQQGVVIPEALQEILREKEQQQNKLVEEEITL